MFPVDWLRRLLYSVNRRAVVVLGNQKSGTSAIAHLLADACGLSKTVDIPEVWPPTMVDVLQERVRLSGIAASHPKPFSADLIKEPYLTFIATQVRELFPAGRFVFVLRDPRDNIRSILNRLEIPGQLDRYESSSNRLPTAWAPILDPGLWGIDRGPRDYLGILAERWLLAVNAFRSWPGSVERIRYEDFMEDKVGSIDRLARRLGLDPRFDISDRVDVQFQPRGDREVSWEDFFGLENLARIERICGPEMRHEGYVPARL